ncbi:hypothetical protein BT69DRAFT_1294402 [Atractiella rhizophila]|nr:hypothetical protein BT69DRAFT_1294402 [Atractiella rhizophila]
MPTLKIAIIFYSLYGHVKTLSESVVKGVTAVDICQLPEIRSNSLQQHRESSLSRFASSLWTRSCSKEQLLRFHGHALQVGRHISSTGGQHPRLYHIAFPRPSYGAMAYIPIGFADPEKSLLDGSEIIGGSA